MFRDGGAPRAAPEMSGDGEAPAPRRRGATELELVVKNGFLEVVDVKPDVARSQSDGDLYRSSGGCPPRVGDIASPAPSRASPPNAPRAGSTSIQDSRGSGGGVVDEDSQLGSRGRFRAGAAAHQGEPAGPEAAFIGRAAGVDRRPQRGLFSVEENNGSGLTALLSVAKSDASQGITADTEEAISMKSLGGPSRMESSLDALSDARHASVSAQTVNSIRAQTNEYVENNICQTCGSERVLHDCGHWQCTTLTCRPAWYQKFEARQWLVPQTSARILDEQLFQTRGRCVDCRPEGRCLKGACPRYCNFIFRRGTCKFGARCSFCHLHGRASASEKFKGGVAGAADVPRPPSGSHLPPPRQQWLPLLKLDKPEFQCCSATSNGMEIDSPDSLRGCWSDNKPLKVAWSSRRVIAVVPSPKSTPDANAMFQERR